MVGNPHHREVLASSQSRQMFEKGLVFRPLPSGAHLGFGIGRDKHHDLDTAFHGIGQSHNDLRMF
jgi:hypothetical protein